MLTRAAHALKTEKYSEFPSHCHTDHHSLLSKRDQQTGRRIVDPVEIINLVVVRPAFEHAVPELDPDRIVEVVSNAAEDILGASLLRGECVAFEDHGPVISRFPGSVEINERHKAEVVVMRVGILALETDVGVADFGGEPRPYPPLSIRQKIVAIGKPVRVEPVVDIERLAGEEVVVVKIGVLREGSAVVNREWREQCGDVVAVTNPVPRTNAIKRTLVQFQLLWKIHARSASARNLYFIVTGAQYEASFDIKIELRQCLRIYAAYEDDE